MNKNTVIKVLSEVTEQLGEDLKTSLIKANRVATGKTNSEIESIQLPDSAQLVAPDHITDLETGKKPGSRSDLGDLDRWLQARGLREEWTPQSLDDHIFKYGFEGTPGVISIPLSDKNIDDYMEISLEQLAIMATSELTDLIKI